MSRINIKNDFQDGNTLYGDELNINNNVIMAGVNDNYERIIDNDDDITALDTRVTQNEADIISLNTNKANKTDVAASIADLEDRKANKTDVAVSVADLESRKANKTDVAASVTDLDNRKANKTDVGNKADLTTSDKTTIVAAINSLNLEYFPIATTSNIGLVKPDGTSITIENDGTIHSREASIATSSVAGIVKPDNATINVDASGTISANTPKVKTITLESTDWVKNQVTDLYECTIVDLDVTTSHFIELTGTIANQILKDSEVESFTGYYVVRTTEAPESNIDATVKIELTNPVVSGGSL